MALVVDVAELLAALAALVVADEGLLAVGWVLAAAPAAEEVYTVLAAALEDELVGAFAGQPFVAFFLSSSQCCVQVAVAFALMSHHHYTLQKTLPNGKGILPNASPFAVASSASLGAHLVYVASVNSHCVAIIVNILAKVPSQDFH